MSENINLNTNQNPEEESTLTLNEIWHMIWDNKWWYVVCTIFCLLFVCFHIYRTPDVYQSTTKVIIDESDQSSTMRSLTQFRGSSFGFRSNTTVANEMEALVSPDLMQEVVEKLNLETKYYSKQFLRSVELYQQSPVELRRIEGNPQKSFAFTVAKKGDGSVVLKDFVIGPDKAEGEVVCAVGDTVMTPAGTLALIPTEFMDEGFKYDISVSWVNSMSRGRSICRALQAGLSDKESTVVVMSLTDNFPSRASAILNTLIDTYNEDWLRNKTRSARKTSEFINERLLLLEKELGGVEDELQQYKEKNKLSDMTSMCWNSAVSSWTTHTISGPISPS